MTPDSPPLAPVEGSPGRPGRARRGRVLYLVVGVVGVLLAGGALLWSGGPVDEMAPEPAPTRTEGPSPTPTTDSDAERSAAVEALLGERASAVLDGDHAAWRAQVDPIQVEFAEAQSKLIERLDAVPFEEWGYQLVGEGPSLPEERVAALPEGSTIVRVRLTYRIAGTETQTDRDQYLTVVPRDGRWLIAADTDASIHGLDTQRDLWDLGAVRLVRGKRSTVVADRGASRAAAERLAREADAAVDDVNEVWRADWSRQPVVLLPGSQSDLATLIDNNGEGLAQIAAVTTGAFEDGLARGDRIMINPEAFDTLGALGRKVVLAHETTHLATRATSAARPPIWLSEGFADYVAYEATPVPVTIVALDVLDDVRAGEAPRKLPERSDFDAGKGDIAAAYEGAWLACRLIAEEYGDKSLVRLYREMSDDSGPGWPEETSSVLGITSRQLTRDWRTYLRELAARP